MPRINQMSQHIWFWDLLQCDTKKAQSSLCKYVDSAEPSLLQYTKNRCRLSIGPEFSPTVSALAHIWYKYQNSCNVPNLQLSIYIFYSMIKKVETDTFSNAK